MMFAANKSHWYSAAELAIFVLTGGHCIETHRDQVLFTSRPHYMLQECKRLFNNEAGGTDSKDQQARRQDAKDQQKPVQVDMLQVSAAQISMFDGGKSSAGPSSQPTLQNRAIKHVAAAQNRS